MPSLPSFTHGTTPMSRPKLSDEQLNKIHHGDCIAGMNALPAGSVDLVFADPPFNIGYDYDVYDDRQSREEYLGWTTKWLTAVKRVLKPNGSFYVARQFLPAFLIHLRDALQLRLRLSGIRPDQGHHRQRHQHHQLEIVDVGDHQRLQVDETVDPRQRHRVACGGTGRCSQQGRVERRDRR
jgi:hypothetical protein